MRDARDAFHRNQRVPAGKKRDLTGISPEINGVWRLDPANYTYRALQNIRELNLSAGIRKSSRTRDT